MARAALKVIPGGAGQQQVYDQLSRADRNGGGGRGTTGGGKFDPDGRRIIQHDPGMLPEVLDQLGQALAEQAADLFVWGEGLARVYVLAQDQDGAHERVRRKKGAVLLHAVKVPHLAELAGRVAWHEKFDARGERYKRCDCPPKVCESYLARGCWPELPSLAGFVEAPIMTLDGRVIDKPGFDGSTGLFLAFDAIPGYQRPPPTPGVRDAAEAADRLLALVRTFPFVSPADEMAAVAGMMLSVLRRSLPAAPMLSITAPTPGTGKSLLADTFAVLATGRRASVISIGQDEIEADKRITGVLMAGDSVVLIDNIERPLGGELLCQVLSQPSVRVRPLGGSAMTDLPTQTLMIANGNNLSVVGDLKRRVTLIRLDAKMERPELRTQFEGQEPHLDRVLRLRGELITAVMTIVLAYRAAGHPRLALSPLGGFEDWDQMIRRPLCWLGLADPLGASSVLRDEDPDLEATRAILSAWYAVFKDAPTSASDVVRIGMAQGEAMDAANPTHPELREALLLVSRGRSPTATSLGHWLRSHKDRIVSCGEEVSLRVAATDPDRNGVVRWRVVSG